MAPSLTPAVAYEEWPDFYGADSTASSLYAIRPPNLHYHNVGPFHVMVTNMGTLGNPQVGDEHYSARWAGGEYLHDAQLWIGAIASDNLEYVSGGFEFRPSHDPIDRIYPSFEGALGGHRAGFAYDQGDDDGDGARDEDFLNGKDDDGDGLIDEDYAATAQQMLCCEYWDYTEDAISSMLEHHPLHLKVQQTTYSWSGEGENEFVGIRYHVTNVGYEVLRQVYLGFVVDADVGRKTASAYWNDDRGHIRMVDTTYIDPSIHYRCGGRDCSRQYARFLLPYMRDVPGRDGGSFTDDLPEDQDGYLGAVLLGHTTDFTGQRAPSEVGLHACRFFRKLAGHEMEDFARYNLLAEPGIESDSTQVPYDYAYLLSVGPYPELRPGEALDFEVALVVGAHWIGLAKSAVAAQRIYGGQWRDTDGSRWTGCGGRETCLRIEPGAEALVWMNPCTIPMEEVLVKNDNCRSPFFFHDTDCDCCTPVQVSDSVCLGWETKVHWVGSVAPPAPHVNTEDPRMRAELEGNHSIRLEWENTPETVVDPISGEQRFCGYRIWRVEGWTRPYGSAGPAPEEWQLIADISPEPVGYQLDLANHTNANAKILQSVASPINPQETYDIYEIGRYFYEDRAGLKNGMLYFYDIVSYSCWYAGGEYQERSQPPAALEAEGVCPRWDAVRDGSWKDRVAVVPNPYRGGAAWDLTPSSADPLGTHIDFINLPARACRIQIYSLAGDRVQAFNHDGRNGVGSVAWNLLSRNGQEIVSGVYLYTVTCGDDTVVGRFTVIR